MMRISKTPQERKTEIINTALELFMEHGYEGTSVSMIVSRVGVAQGLFYYYFRSKEAVFEAAIELYTDQLARTVITSLLSPEPRSIAERLGDVLPKLSELLRHSEGPLMNGMSIREIGDIDTRFSFHLSQILIEPVSTLLFLFSDRSGIRLSAAPDTLAAFVVFGIYGLIHGLTGSGHHNTDALNPALLLPVIAGAVGAPVDTLLSCQFTIPEEVLS